MNTLEQSKALQQQLLSAYVNIFKNQNSLQDIRAVLKALQNNSPFLSYHLSSDGTDLVASGSQPDIGSSFSSIFLPFHIGQEYPLNFRQILSEASGIEPLISFMERCAKLEKLTEQFAYAEVESTIKHKEEIIRELQMFIDEFPSTEIFKQWISAIDAESVS